MDIKREKIGTLNELISISFVPADYQETVDKSLKELKRKANEPGFRAGHVPMGIINKKYGKAVLVEEISKLTNDKIYDYLKENKLDILFEPIAKSELTKGNFETPENFEFTFEVGIRPALSVDYQAGKNLVNYHITASDKEIETEIESMRRRVGKFSSTEVVVDEDMILVTVTPEEGAEFSSSLILNYIKDDQKKIFIGSKLHDVIEFDTTKVFKSDYERSTFLKVKMEEIETATKKVSVKIDAIHHIDPADLDDEFYKKMFPDGSIKDEKSLREKVASQIELRYVNDANMFFRNAAMEALMEAVTVDLPDNFIKKYLVETNENYTAQNIEEKFDDIKKSIIYQLLEDQISKDCQINVERQEVIDYVKNYVRLSYFGTSETLPADQELQVTNFANQMVNSQENLKNAYENLFFEKLTAGLIEKIAPKTKALDYQAFIDDVSKLNKTSKAKSSKPKVDKEAETTVEESKPKTSKAKKSKE